MNDLERDLRQLFDDRARRAGGPAAAPEQVLRRGRRREMRTIAMGVVASVVVIAVAFAVANVVRTPVDKVPGGSQELPARSTTIGGVPVTAPAGWTLVDDTPVLNTIATGSSCSFSGTGTPVDANGSPTGSTPSGETAVTFCEGVTSATTSTSLAAGVPFFQLANFDIPLMESVCASKRAMPTSLPDDGVALYVASFPNGYDAQAALDACPGAERYGERSGENGFTFGLATNDQSIGLNMAAIAVAGPAASDADIAVIRSFFDQPIFGTIDRYVALDPTRVGPGYVVAAGGTDDAGWRLEAGIGSYAEGGRPIAASIFVTTSATSETAQRDENFGDSEGMDVVGGQVLQHGNVGRGTVGVTVTGPDGTVTEASVYPWPQGLRDVADSQPLDNAGGIWLAAPPQRGDVEFVRASTPAPFTGSPMPSSQEAPVGQLQTRTDANGFDQVIYGSDLGHDWELRHTNGEIALSVDGASYGSFAMVNGQWREYDVDGGSYIIGIFDNSVDRLFVAKDPVGSTGLIIDGRFAIAQDANGQPGRVWLIPIAGTGAGTLRAGSDVTPLGWQITWPSATGTSTGTVLRAGGDGITYSWSLMLRGDHCAQLLWQIPRATQIADCLPPWSDLQKQGGVPLIGGQYLSDPGDTSGIAIVMPAGTSISSFRSDGDQPGPDCTTIQNETSFAGTEFCVLPLAIGSLATITLDNSGDPLGSPYRIQAQPGRVHLWQGDAVGPAASPTPSP